MSDSEAVRELFLKLGFKIDEAGFRHFNEAITSSEKALSRISFGLIAAATATGVFVDKMAASMENLYFVSKRTGASVDEIKDFSLSLQNAGGSAQQAVSALEGIANFRRRFGQGADSALEQWFKIDPKDINDSEKVLEGIQHQLKALKDAGKMPLAISLGESVGLDISTITALTSSDFKKDTTAADMAKDLGTDLTGNARGAHELEDNFRKLDVEIGVFGSALEAQLNGPFKNFTTWFGEALVKIGAFENAVKNFGVGDTLKDAGVPESLVDYYSGNFSSLPQDFSDDYKSGENNLTKLGVIAPEGEHHTLLGRYWEAYKNLTKRNFGRLSSVVSNASWASNPKTKEAVDFFMSKEGGGYSQAQALGITSNLIDESGLNPQAVGDNGAALGLGQTHAERRKGLDFSKMDFHQQLQFLASELKEKDKTGAGITDTKLRSDTTAADAARDFSLYDERPLGGELTAGARAMRASGLAREYTVNQTNNITIHGAVDANKETPGLISSAIGDKTSQLTGQFAK